MGLGTGLPPGPGWFHALKIAQCREPIRLGRRCHLHDFSAWVYDRFRVEGRESERLLLTMNECSYQDEEQEETVSSVSLMMKC